MNPNSVKYFFEFFFYNKYANNFRQYFENQDRLSIWNEDQKEYYIPAMFLDFIEEDGKIKGNMELLLPDDYNLYDNDNRKYYMNYPHNLVGHLILQKPASSDLDT